MLRIQLTHEVVHTWLMHTLSLTGVRYYTHPACVAQVPVPLSASHGQLGVRPVPLSRSGGVESGLWGLDPHRRGKGGPLASGWLTQEIIVDTKPKRPLLRPGSQAFPRIRPDSLNVLIPLQGGSQLPAPAQLRPRPSTLVDPCFHYPEIRQVPSRSEVGGCLQLQGTIPACRAFT